MINVVVISNSANHSDMLSQYSDIATTLIGAYSLELIIESVHDLSPDIIVIDNAPDDMTVDMLCYELSINAPKSQCIILIDEMPTFEMLQNSGFKARGYLTLDQWSSLPKAVRVVHDGEAWLPRRLVAEMLNRFILDLGH